MKQALTKTNTKQGVSMKKTLFVMALAVVLVFALAATALATSAKTWNYQADYYSWGSNYGNGIQVSTGTANTSTNTLGLGGAVVTNASYTSGILNSNQTAGGGVHSNYTSTTAKCGICHSVHRAKGDGVHLLNTSDATCAGCHISGTSTVTNVVVAWGTTAAKLAGPHSSASGSCTSRSCHATSPHGVGGSEYGLFNAKLLNAAVDEAVSAAASNPASSGVTAALLTGAGANTNFTGQADAVRIGYTCNQAGCHEQSQFAVIKAKWAENKEGVYPGTEPWTVSKTGHLSVSAVGTTAYTAASSCAGCHDQTDSTTRSGYTFPHAQRATGAGAGVQTYLWYNIAGNTTDAKVPMQNQNMKSFDGACLKCHRTTTSGVGIAF
jgi:hypothetical protein